MSITALPTSCAQCSAVQCRLVYGQPSTDSSDAWSACSPAGSSGPPPAAGPPSPPPGSPPPPAESPPPTRLAELSTQSPLTPAAAAWPPRSRRSAPPPAPLAHCTGPAAHCCAPTARLPPCSAPPSGWRACPSARPPPPPSGRPAPRPDHPGVCKEGRFSLEADEEKIVFLSSDVWRPAVQLRRAGRWRGCVREGR